VALETLGPMSVRTQEFLAQIGMCLTEVMTDPVKRRSHSSACWSPSNASKRLPSWHIRNFRALITSIPDI